MAINTARGVCFLRRFETYLFFGLKCDICIPSFGFCPHNKAWDELYACVLVFRVAAYDTGRFISAVEEGGRQKRKIHAGARTRNLLLRRQTPYPLGHTDAGEIILGSSSRDLTSH